MADKVATLKDPTTDKVIAIQDWHEDRQYDVPSTIPKKRTVRRSATPEERKP
jgi:hypothetical protein